MTEHESDSTPMLTGWEPDAPLDDSLVRRFILNQVAFNKAAGLALGGAVLENDRFAAIDTGRPAPFLNVVDILKPMSGPELELTMSELDQFLLGSGQTGWVGLFGILPTPDLQPYGWTLGGHPPLHLRHPNTPLIETSQVDLQRADTPKLLAIFERITIEGFSMDEMHGAPVGSLVPPTLLEDDRYQAWLGYVDGVAVAAAGSFVDSGVVNICMVATLAQARRKGAGLAVTQAATRTDLQLPAMLISSDDGRRVYERLGYETLFRGSFWFLSRG